MTGSTRVARRVGTETAMNATAIRTAAAEAMGTAAAAGRFSTLRAANRVLQNAVGAPRRNPTQTNQPALVATMRLTRPRVAPRAIRMPISFVWRATV
jgi:hypothetical protein